MMENYDSERKKERIRDMMIMKQCLRIKYQFYCLAVSRKEKPGIMSILSEYTTNFILLTTNNINDLKDIIIYCCDAGNCAVLLENIFRDDFTSPAEFECSDSSDNLEYILFAKVKEVPQKLISSEPEYNIIVGNYIYENIKKLISKNYVYNRLCICGGYAFLEYIDNSLYTHKEIESAPDDLFILLSGGIGDLFIHFSLLYEFVKEKLNQYRKIYTIGVSSYKWDYISKIVFKDEITPILFDNMYMLNQWHEIGKENMLNTFRFYDNEGMHIYDRFREALGFTNKVNNPYKYNAVLNGRIKESILEDEIKLIDALLPDKTFIGFHFFTGEFFSNTQEWRTTSPGRNWNYENIELFLKKAHENNIDIIILSPHPYSSFLKYAHLPKLSISGYIYAVSKLKLVIDIDSSAGHIASFYDIPTITIWGETTPLSTHFKHKLGFRVLRNNISIVSRNENIENISYETVYNTLINVLRNGIGNSEQIMTYEESMNGFNTVYVN